jgi:hypothetical protein
MSSLWNAYLRGAKVNTETASVNTDIGAVELYVSRNCWVGTVLPDLKDPCERFHILPATKFGLVAVISAKYPPLVTKPIYGCIVYRPKMMELVFPENVRVHVVTLATEDMKAWCKDTLPWIQVGKRNAKTRNTAW